MSLEWATLRSLADMTDDLGVLSVYVTVDPAEEPTPRPAWQLRLRHELAQVREVVRAQGPRERWAVVTARLEALRPELDRLLDPTTAGLGRALFATVGDGDVRTVSLQVPLVDRVALESRAQLMPLVAAWSAAGPAGVVSVSAEEVRVIDLRFGQAEDVGTIPYPTHLESRELKGPAGANPTLPQQGALHRDLFARREGDRLARFLRTLGSPIARQARECGWEYLALTGEAPLTHAVAQGLPGPLPADVLTLTHPVNSMPATKLAATVAPALDEARQRRKRTLAERAHDAALSAATGACGLGETLDALQQGRVGHLLLAGEGQWRGRRAPDGRLVPDREVPPGVTESALVPEPYLGERMIELAFREGASVTVLDPVSATALADHDGIGAILRW